MGSPWKWINWMCLATAVALGGCAPNLDTEKGEDKEVRIDAANIALSKQECDKAIGLIDPIYNSKYSDNRVRMIRASAYACAAGVNFFGMLADLTKDSSKLTSNEMWQVFTKLFPSSATSGADKVVEGAAGATDALLSAIIPAGVISQEYLFNTDTFNPQSALYTDRIDDSNIYLTFVSIAGIGGMNNRFGAPDADYKKTKALPWTTANADNMDTDGCEYASFLVNFADSLGGLADAAQGQAASSLAKIKDAFQSVIYKACDVGCHNYSGTDIGIPGWQASGCTVTDGSCDHCPALLRDRTSCQKKTSDLNSCAAAGIVNFMNYSELGWQGP